jgi:hypothetical protein
MSRAAGCLVVAGVVLSGAGLLLFRAGGGTGAAEAAEIAAKVAIDYPLNGAMFPPEITAPTFLWHDPAKRAKRWVIEVSFGKTAPQLRIECPGDLLTPGEIDAKAGPMEPLTPEMASAHTWRPGAETWAAIKQQSTGEPAGVTIEGIDEGGAVVSSGHVAISTSADPVGAPLFYRDVPLMLPSKEQKGPITPLPREALPLIKWRTRNIAEAGSKVVMEKLPTCAMTKACMPCCRSRRR